MKFLKLNGSDLLVENWNGSSGKVINGNWQLTVHDGEWQARDSYNGTIVSEGIVSTLDLLDVPKDMRGLGYNEIIERLNKGEREWQPAINTEPKTIISVDLDRSDQLDCLILTTRCTRYKLHRDDGDAISDGEFDFLKSMVPALVDRMIEDDLEMERESSDEDYPRVMCEGCGLREASIGMTTCWFC